MSTTPKKFCFVLMPFTDHFDDIYKLGIKQSCIDAGAYCERVDEQIYRESMLERIYNQISKADIVIADMTDRNPNVFYEVGYAHALGKTTILLTKDAADIPFDLKHYPHIIYNNKISLLKDELTTRIKWYLEDGVNGEKNQKVDLDLYLGEDNLSSRGVKTVVEEKAIPVVNFTLHNKSFKTYESGEFSIGIITDINYPQLRKPQGKTISLPDGKLMHMYPPIEDILYPASYASIEIALERKILEYTGDIFVTPKLFYSEEQEIIIRLFTPNGPRDFYLVIEYSEEGMEEEPSQG